MFHSLLYRESRLVDVHLLAPDGPTGVRICSELRQPEVGHWVLGDDQTPISLDICNGLATWTFDPSGQPLLLGLRLIELLQAITTQGELVLVDANTMNVEWSMRGTFDYPIDPRLIGTLRRLAYVVLRCRINDMKLPDDITEADETNIETMYRLLKGERIFGRTSGRSENGPTDLLSISDFRLSAVGQVFSLGPAWMEVSAVESRGDEFAVTGFLSLVSK